MKRVLLRSPAFVRAARRVLKKYPTSGDAIEQALDRLGENAYDPRLRSHKLKGRLRGSWACTATYELRIVFRFVEHGGSEAILLQTMGTHDEVY